MGGLEGDSGGSEGTLGGSEGLFQKNEPIIVFFGFWDRFSAVARKSEPIIFFSAPKCIFSRKSEPIWVFSAPKWALE